MASRASKVKFFFDGAKASIKERNRLKKLIEFIFKNELKPLESINYIFCSDKKLLLINKEYLNHDYLTDIVTFDLSEKVKPIIAEVYISIERVRENAIQLNEFFKVELYRVIIHGALHLCGYGDKTYADKKKMRLLEDFYLKKIME